MDSKKILKINQLNVNTGGTWRICAKVVEKSDIKSYDIANTNGRRFVIDVSDSTDTIRIVAFGDEVDKFYSKIEINGLYIISGGQIKMSNKQFNRLAHDCEIILNKTTTIEEYELSTSSSHHVTNAETEIFLKENKEDYELISKQLKDIDEQHKIEKQKLDSKLRRLTCERNSLLNRPSL